MSQVSNIEIPVAAATAAALTDSRRPAAVGRLVDRLVRPGADGPLIALLEQIAAETQAAGLTEAEIKAELTAYNGRVPGEAN
jgi:hypothetical protein